MGYAPFWRRDTGSEGYMLEWLERSWSKKDVFFKAIMSWIIQSRCFFADLARKLYGRRRIWNGSDNKNRINGTWPLLVFPFSSKTRPHTSMVIFEDGKEEIWPSTFRFTSSSTCRRDLSVLGCDWSWISVKERSESGRNKQNTRVARDSENAPKMIWIHILRLSVVSNFLSFLACPQRPARPPVSSVAEITNGPGFRLNCCVASWWLSLEEEQCHDHEDVKAFRKICASIYLFIHEKILRKITMQIRPQTRWLRSLFVCILILVLSNELIKVE